MLDLNLNVESSESTHYQYQQYRYPEGLGTSDSSIVNADASSNDGSCSTRACRLQREWKRHRCDERVFPCEQWGWSWWIRGIGSIFPLKGSKRLAGEVRVMQTPSQQVKKSRRGPRSRSSQFYRRTGRWESHICNHRKRERGARLVLKSKLEV